MAPNIFIRSSRPTVFLVPLHSGLSARTVVVQRRDTSVPSYDVHRARPCRVRSRGWCSSQRSCGLRCNRARCDAGDSFQHPSPRRLHHRKQMRRHFSHRQYPAFPMVGFDWVMMSGASFAWTKSGEVVGAATVQSFSLQHLPSLLA